VAELLTVQALFTLVMLVLLQAVLGFDNLLYIAIESNKVGDEDDAKKVRKWGIGIAVLLRIVLLFLIVKLFAFLAEPLFGVHLKGFFEGEFTAQALITLVGGGFIIYTAIKEIHHLLQVDHIEHSEGSGKRSVKGAITLIVLMNLVFSVDSILSAMAIASVPGVDGGAPTYQVELMVIAILLSGLAMILLADRVTESFYLVVFVLVVTDVISNRYQKRLWAQKQAEILGSTEVAGRDAVDAFKGSKSKAH